MQRPDGRSEAPATRTGWIAERAIGDGIVVATLLAWWLLAQRLPDFVLPGPIAVFEAIARLFYNPDFLVHTLSSTLRILVSVVAALVIGGALAVLPRYVPLLEGVVYDRIQPVLNSFPSLGWAMLAVIWFNISNFSVIFVQIAILIPFCLINIREGLRELDRELLEMGRSLTRQRAKVFVKIVVPQLHPYVMAATRISYGVAWKVALVSELFGADTGLGFLMLRAQSTSDAAMVFATCFAIVLIFYAGEKLIIDPLSRLYKR